MPVKSLRVCAYAATFIDPPNESAEEPRRGGMTNHWVLVWTLSTGGLVYFDPSPSGPNMSLVLLASHRHSDLDGIVKTMPLEFEPESVTVGAILQVLKSSRFDAYQFTESGQGCRYWLYHVLELLRSEDILSNDAQVSTVKAALKLVWGEDGHPVPVQAQTDMQRGKFLEPLIKVQVDI